MASCPRLRCSGEPCCHGLFSCNAGNPGMPASVQNKTQTSACFGRRGHGPGSCCFSSDSSLSQEQGRILSWAVARLTPGPLSKAVFSPLQHAGQFRLPKSAMTERVTSAISSQGSGWFPPMSKYKTYETRTNVEDFHVNHYSHVINPSPALMDTELAIKLGLWNPKEIRSCQK